MNQRRIKLGWMIGLMTIAGCATSGARMGATESPRWSLAATPLERSAAELSNQTAEHIAWAKAERNRLLEVPPPRTIENTLEPYNQMMMHLDAARAECELFARVHPDKTLREAAEQGEQDVTTFLTELKLDRGLYDVFRALDVSRADAATKYLHYKILRDFRRAGVDKPEDVRQRVAALNEEIVTLGQDFDRNIRENDREIVLDSLADLDGLPSDWIDRHQPGSDGKIRVTTRYPDYYPFLTYANNTDARLALYREFKNRGYPKNIDVLDRLLKKRYELATLLGYAHWADYSTEDKMIETGANAQTFIDRIAALSKASVQRDYGMLLERKRRDAPDAKDVGEWESMYYGRLVKAERFGFDPQAARPYFNFPDVMRGLFDLTQRLFGVTYCQVDGLRLWHPEVTAWDVYDGERCIGRFYLDLHPRDNKYGHAAQFDYRAGIEGQRLPQAVLVCNFPDPSGTKDGLALMEHSEVVTLFHEFGHLLHAIFSGHQRWMGNSGISTEWDFVEAPSQMLEEWCFDLEALRVFAKHYQTGEPIPAELVANLNRASDFGKGLNAAHQMFFAAASLNYHSRDPQGLDTTRTAVDLQRRYSPYDYVDGTHFQCSFGHLNGYSAYYYTYMWSKVIAKDLHSQFLHDGMMNTNTARRYRETVLYPGGSKRAAELVRDFLGRPYSFDAFEAWLNRS